jgi:hypothetical protein
MGHDPVGVYPALFPGFKEAPGLYGRAHFTLIE